MNRLSNILKSLTATHLFGIITIGCLLLCISFGANTKSISKGNQVNEVILEWYDFFMKAELQTNGYYFPIAARTFGYLGLAGYESTLPIYYPNIYKHYLTQPIFSDKALNSTNKPDLIIATLNACYSQMAKLFYGNAANSIDLNVDSLYHVIQKKIEKSSSAAEIDLKYAKQLGIQVAQKIYQYSEQDTIGHLAHLYFINTNYITPKGTGLWQNPNKTSPKPIAPFWGNTHLLNEASGKITVPPPPDHDTTSNSIFYKQAIEIYTLYSDLTHENKWKIDFWDDDHPKIVLSHPAHWISIACQVFKKEQPKPQQTLESLFRLGLALHDVGVLSWKAKYTYNLERPEEYIKKYIDTNWRPTYSPPAHPSYPSGHASFGFAAAHVLTSMFGDQYNLTDYTHENRTLFKVKPRSFTSFQEMAIENSQSRVLMGVHYRFDCDAGAELGDKVGAIIMKINLRQNHSTAEIPTSNPPFILMSKQPMQMCIDFF